VAPDLPPGLRREVRQTLADLRVAHLAATAWPISQATFEGKVRGRLAGANRAAAYVAATKETSALPWVGLVSAVILVVVGYLIGGWVIAGGTLVLAVLVAAVAYAGSHTNRARQERRAAQALAPTKERTEPVPLVVAEAIGRIEALLGPPGRGRAERGRPGSPPSS